MTFHEEFNKARQRLEAWERSMKDRTPVLLHTLFNGVVRELSETDDTALLDLAKGIHALEDPERRTAALHDFERTFRLTAKNALRQADDDAIIRHRTIKVHDDEEADRKAAPNSG